MKEVIILIGNIGAGKSTLCKKYAKQGYIIISKDSVRYMIGAGEYKFDERTEPLIHQMIIDFYMYCLNKGFNVVIDETNMDKETRGPFVRLGKSYKYQLKAIVFPLFDKETSVDRRMSSNHGNTTKEIWEDVWQRKTDTYQEPTYKEGFNTIELI